MKTPKIINRGRGPELEGTRITVYNVYEYSRLGRSRDYIAAVLRISSAKVQCALDYIADHEEEVRTAFDEILERIRQGNPEWVEEHLRKNRPRFEEFVRQCREKGGNGNNGQDHVGQ